MPPASDLDWWDGWAEFLFGRQVHNELRKLSNRIQAGGASLHCVAEWVLQKMVPKLQALVMKLDLPGLKLKPLPLACSPPLSSHGSQQPLPPSSLRPCEVSQRGHPATFNTQTPTSTTSNRLQSSSLTRAPHLIANLALDLSAAEPLTQPQTLTQAVPIPSTAIVLPRGRGRPSKPQKMIGESEDEGSSPKRKGNKRKRKGQTTNQESSSDDSDDGQPMTKRTQSFFQHGVASESITSAPQVTLLSCFHVSVILIVKLQA